MNNVYSISDDNNILKLKLYLKNVVKIGNENVIFYVKKKYVIYRIMIFCVRLEM